ncbi:MAG: hypothetical protein K0S09_1515 [Sphingobacteriaceae bacterium]|nr:hypothetical protein [Sphingobacteriaceae bacterium]
MDLIVSASNEEQRISALADLDLDYSDLQNNFTDLTRLAARVAGTEISLVNLIDSYTQWSISSFGLDLEQMPREDSVCQYTMLDDQPFEVKDLRLDERFKDKFYVSGNLSLRYYFGIPLRTRSGLSLGALCVLDGGEKELDPEKIELLKIIANEIVNRLRSLRVIEELKRKLIELRDAQKKVAHDIRSPLGGIIGLSQMISEGNDTNMDEVMEVFNLIYKSGNSILELADEILRADDKVEKKDSGLMSHQLSLATFKEKLEKLYRPQAINKNIKFSISTSAKTENIPLSKNKLLQITGNLISNSIKFTPVGGFVEVNLNLDVDKQPQVLHISVKDSGVGLTDEKISYILSGDASSTSGTSGEKGYGFGLALVKHLVDSLNGTMSIHSSPNQGAEFEIVIPQ